jgi:acyl transferase domain-containing protein
VSYSYLPLSSLSLILLSSALGGPLRQIFKAANSPRDLSYASCLERKKDETVTMLGLAGYLFQRAVPLDMSAIVPRASVLTDLPTPSWSHDATYRSENRAVRDW